MTNIVARVLECATGTDYASLLSRDLWGPIGAEHPAEIVVDSKGFPIAEAGICCSLRDLARVGLAHLDGDSNDQACVVPQRWIDDCFRIDSVARDAFVAAMRTRGIGLGIHYPSVPGMTYYRNRGWDPSDFPVAERIGAETVTLPLFPAMADADVDRVCDALLELLPR